MDMLDSKARRAERRQHMHKDKCKVRKGKLVSLVREKGTFPYYSLVEMSARSLNRLFARMLRAELVHGRARLPL